MIPYTTEPRADTGVTNGRMGIWLFLASEVMLMGGLASAYALIRAGSPDWAGGGAAVSAMMPIAGTALLVGAVTLAGIGRSGPRRASLLPASALLCALFLVLQGLDYARLLALDIHPATSMFFALYYVLTGVHGLHVLGGTLAIGWVMAGGSRVPAELSDERAYSLWLYWIFVGCSWLLTVGLLWF